MTSAWDPTGSICVEYLWNWPVEKAGIKGTLVKSDFIGLPGVIENVFQFGIGSNEKGNLLNYACCYINFAELSQIGFKATAVTCNKNSSGLCDSYKMDQVGSDSTCSLFHLDLSFRTTTQLIFRVYLAPTVEHYALHRFDALSGQNLWTAAVSALLTDVLFHVGDVAFPVHKFVLSARSPVFQVMFESNMIESRTGRVQIVDAEPEIFKQFLYFIYTGQLMKPASQELGVVADKYDVETLTSLCQSVDELVTINEGVAAVDLERYFDNVTSSIGYGVTLFPFATIAINK